MLIDSERCFEQVSPSTSLLGNTQLCVHVCIESETLCAEGGKNIHNKNQKRGRGSRLLEDQELLSKLFLSGMRDDLELFLTRVETPLAPPPIIFQPHVAQRFRVECAWFISGQVWFTFEQVWFAFGQAGLLFGQVWFAFG